MAISEVVLSIGQEIVMDVVKDIYADVTLSFRLEKDLKKAITKAVKKELPYEKDSKIIEAISNDIFIACTEEEIYNLKLPEIIEKTLLEHGDYNKNPKLLARGIAASLPMEIIKSRELNALINSKLAFESLVKNKEILDELGIIKKNIQNSKFDNQETREILIYLMEISKGLIDNEKKMEFNNKFIPEKYKEYFYNKLFLEDNIKDKEEALLKDVYIKPHFLIMDLERSNENYIGDNIIKFIEDFVGVKRRDNSYRPIFNFKNKFITTLFIKGHPGSGKSSLFYYLAYMKSHESEFLTDYKMFFIKLIELYKENNNVLSEKNPLKDIETHLDLEDKSFNNTVLVLDGLDEICAAKDINIYEYCSHLIESTFKYRNFKIIITTRLNYINIDYKENKNVLNIRLQNWTISDLKQWTDKFFDIHKECDDLAKVAITNIQYLADTKNEEMLTILAVPLLFYMITAIGLDLNKLESIGQLYDKVFDELYVRNYSENVNVGLQKCGIIKAIPKKVSRQIAMEIAYKMYQENELLLKVNSEELKQAIENALANEEIIEIDMFYKRQIEKLFPITFFYKEVYDVVEFAHKSIMEFFCAEKLFYMFKNQSESINEFILHNMVENVISIEVLQFFIYFLKKEIVNTEKYKKDILVAFKRLVNNGEQLTQINQKAYGFEISKLVFKIYWIFMKDILNCDMEDINEILSNDYMNSYLKGVLSLRDSNNLPFINNEIYKWNFSDCRFSKYNFSYVDINHAYLKDVKLIDCIFVGANLSNCELVNVQIDGFINFSYADLTNVMISDVVSKNGKVFFNYTRINGTMIIKTDIRNWIFSNIIYEGKLLLQSVKMDSSQVEFFYEMNVEYQNVDIYLDKSIVTGKDLTSMKKIHRAERNKWEILLENYIDEFILRWKQMYVAKLKEGVNYNIICDNRIFRKYINEYIYNK